MATSEDSRIGKMLSTITDLAKQGFHSIDDAQPKHYAAIGQFLVAVGTHIDAPLNAQLEFQLGSTEIDTGRALVGEMRTGDIMTALRRIIAARPGTQEVLQEVDALFKEIRVLRSTRDIVAHKSCMVADDRLAFHNATVAKTADAIKVDYFTLAELEDFSKYARRLGYRIVQVFSTQRPTEAHPANHAYADTTAFAIGLRMAVARLEAGNLSPDKVKRLRSIESEASAALKLYSDAARAIDKDFANLKKASAAKSAEFLSALLLLDAPDGEALGEVPTQLRRP